MILALLGYEKLEDEDGVVGGVAPREGYRCLLYKLV